MTTNRVILAHGKAMTLAQWSDKSGINAETIASRIDKWGWSAGDAVTKGVRRADSGLSRVTWEKNRRKWAVTVFAGGKNRHVGRYESLLDAAAARLGNALRDVESYFSAQKAA